jgi:hypothetical protein
MSSTVRRWPTASYAPAAARGALGGRVKEALHDAATAWNVFVNGFSGKESGTLVGWEGAFLKIGEAARKVFDYIDQHKTQCRGSETSTAPWIT